MPKLEPLSIIPKQKPEIPSWVTYLFLGSLISILLLGGIYFFIANKISVEEGKKSALGRQVVELRSNQASQGLKNSAIVLSRKVEDFSHIFKEHKITSRFFDLLRASCHPKVQFTSFDFNANAGTVALIGVGQDFQVLGEQILIFKQDKNIKDVEISGINLSKEGDVSFNINFSIEPNLFLNSKYIR